MTEAPLHLYKQKIQQPIDNTKMPPKFLLRNDCGPT